MVCCVWGMLCIHLFHRDKIVPSFVFCLLGYTLQSWRLVINHQSLIQITSMYQSVVGGGFVLRVPSIVVGKIPEPQRWEWYHPRSHLQLTWNGSCIVGALPHVLSWLWSAICVQVLPHIHSQFFVSLCFACNTIRVSILIYIYIIIVYIYIYPNIGVCICMHWIHVHVLDPIHAQNGPVTLLSPRWLFEDRLQRKRRRWETSVAELS